MRTRSCPTVGWLLIMLALAVGPWAQGQATAPPFKLKKLTPHLRVPPDYGSAGSTLGSHKPNANRPWMELELEFDSDPDWADEVTIKFFVLMTRGRLSKLFTGELTTVNVPKGRHVSAMFLHPNTVDRYGTASKAEAIAAQLYYQGRLIDQISSPQSNQRWWEQFTPIAGYLLVPSQTPWAVIAYQYFEALKGSTP